MFCRMNTTQVVRMAKPKPRYGPAAAFLAVAAFLTGAAFATAVPAGFLGAARGLAAPGFDAVVSDFLVAMCAYVDSESLEVRRVAFNTA